VIELPFLGRRSAALYLLGTLLVAATLVFLGLRLGEIQSQLDGLSRGQVLLLLPAIFLSALSVVGFGLVWSLTLTWLAGKVSPLQSLLRFFIYTVLLAIPGTLPYHAVRVMFAERLAPASSRHRQHCLRGRTWDGQPSRWGPLP
jgi:hypothetical protein